MFTVRICFQLYLIAVDDKNILFDTSLMADLMAELSVKKFKLLPKTGKPNSSEWTVLATVIQQCKNQEQKVVALGTGTKCIGQSKLNSSGCLINDSHAEVLARRAFLRYLYHELGKAASNRADSIFEWNRKKESDSDTYALKSDISFSFFCTQTPCGDACIRCEDEDAPPLKRCKLETTVEDDRVGSVLTPAIFTGAKLIGGEVSDDAMLQTTGAVRTKPGRGDRTLSVSCSDKLARWCVLGVQGALLDTLLTRPIYFTTLNFGCDDAQLDTLERAFYNRWEKKNFSHSRYKQQHPVIHICTTNAVKFEHRQMPEKQPSPNGLVWCDVPEDLRPYEICVNGIRQGVTKKKLNTPQAALKISKFHLLQSYVSLLRECPAIMKRLDFETGTELESNSYANFKKLATCYQEAWTHIKQSYFGQWTHKPIELTQFSLLGCPT